ncbi:unnamed protein product [Rhodiola kirilowii]
MQKPKNNGGLGFKDLDLFNNALLMKQLWRLVKNPELLMSKVLAARYLHGMPLSLAGTGYMPSHAWRSLMKVKDLFLDGLEQGGSDLNNRWRWAETGEFSCKTAYNMIVAH